MSNNITCPNCGHQFSLSDVQKHELEHMRGEMQETIKNEMQKDFDERARSYAMKVKAEAEEQARKQAIELDSYKKRDEESRAKEMQYLKEKQVMEMRAKDMEIEKERAIIEAKKLMEVDIKIQIEKEQAYNTDKLRLEYEKRMAEMQKQLEMTQKAVEDANRKANQGSMQIQGEIQEDALRELLMTNFPTDTISDVEKGIKGADVIQEVRNMNGTVGIIAWESKNTKAWSESWVDKLKEDRLRVNADISILVTAVLPKGVDKFGLYKGVWLVEWSYALPIAIMLRGQIESMSHLRTSLVSKDEKMEVLYNYLTSARFKDKVENIIDAFRQMQDQVAEERRAFESRWKKREQLLEQVIKNTGGMYGDLGGMLGGKLEKVEYLELGGGL
ncbi:DUF2130 domain-containing protein [Candidatus Gracilibacteria bacterium]|nr:DUF2130 domain-containing protein [Candidatus Gracilibacteria bacterium]